MFDLIRKPFGGEVDRFRREWDGFFDRVFGQGSALSGGESLWPSVDVSESKGKYTVTAELPGLEAKDVDVSIEGDVLTIRGEKKKESEEEGENFHRVERSYGSFSRSFRLAGHVNPDKVKAKFKNGVLTLTLPKSAETVGRQIEVRSE